MCTFPKTATAFALVFGAVTVGCGDEAAPATEALPFPTFTSVQPELFGAPGGQTNGWADYDLDGDLDLFVGFRGAPNRLYRNDDGIFVDVAADVGLADEPETRASAWGDYDSDGDPDLYVGFANLGIPNRLYRNEGGTFVDVAETVGVEKAGTSRQPTFLDYDGDGDPDLFVAFRDKPNTLFRNDGGRFTDVTDASGIGDPRRTVGVAWFDMDGDGDLDAFVANQNGDEDGFFQNNGDGTFEDVAERLGMHQPGRAADLGSVGTAVADYDNDGDLDLFVASYGPEVLWENQGDGTFTNASPGTPLAGNHHSVAAAWGDADHDGWLDLYVNTFLSGEVEARDYLFRGGAEGFVEGTPDVMVARGSSHGVAWADYDNDGDLDLALAPKRTGVSGRRSGAADHRDRSERLCHARRGDRRRAPPFRRLRHRTPGRYRGWVLVSGDGTRSRDRPCGRGEPGHRGPLVRERGTPDTPGNRHPSSRSPRHTVRSPNRRGLSPIPPLSTSSKVDAGVELVHLGRSRC
jgi:hypothetical protein